MTKILAVVAFCLLAMQPARAEPYVSGNVLWANGTDPAGSVGGALSIGYDFGPVRTEIEASNHMHLSNGTFGVSGKGYVEADWIVSPYLGVGVGYSFEDTLILTAAVGVFYAVTGSLDLVGGYEHRWYGPIEEFGASEDGYGTFGMRHRF